MKCPNCRKAEMRVEKGAKHHYPESGLPNVTLVGVELRECPECGVRAVAIPRMAELHRVLTRLVVNKPGRLTGAEIRFLRKHLGWSGADFARHFGVDPATVSRWETESEPMGKIAERLLRLAAVHWTPVGEYPVEKLDEVAQEGARPVRYESRVDAHGWQAEAVSA